MDNFKIKLLPKLFHSYANEKFKDSILCGVYVPYLIKINKNDGITMAELTRSVFMDKANTSRVVRELEKQGLVNIKDSEEDKRVKKIFLTSEGKFYIEKIESIKEEWEKSVFDGITEEEKSILNNIIDKVVDNALNLLEKTSKEELND